MFILNALPLNRSHTLVLVLQKSDFYFQCEDANIPAGLIPWHGPCKMNDPRNACELGSQCTERNGKAFCEPDDDLIVVPRSQSRCRRGEGARKAGIAFAVIGSILVLALCSFGPSLLLYLTLC
jgi:hypothetical protein